MCGLIELFHLHGGRQGQDRILFLIAVPLGFLPRKNGAGWGKALETTKKQTLLVYLAGLNYQGKYLELYSIVLKGPGGYLVIENMQGAPAP